MGKQVQVNTGYSRVYLAPGRVADGGQTAVLTDAEYARLSATTLATLTLLGTVADPVVVVSNDTEDAETAGEIANPTSATRAALNSAIANPSTLRWAPPPQVSPTIANVSTGFFSATYGASEDVVLVMPTSARTSTMSITGGRHIRVIGGKIRLNDSTAGTSVMRFLGATGSVFLEGLDIDVNGGGGNTHDAINVYGSTSAPWSAKPDVYIQNVRVVGVKSANTGNHADVFQPQGAIGNLYIDKFTARSNYQGIFIPPAFPQTSRSLSRVDLGYESGGDPVTYLLWLLNNSSGAPSAEVPVPTFLSNVYVTPRSGQNIKDHAVYPSTGLTDANSVAIGALSDDGGATVYWPPFVNAIGHVTSGPPPGGDFVPAASVGLGYVSPGYARPHVAALSEMADVAVSLSANGDVLKWDATTSRWKNAQPTVTLPGAFSPAAHGAIAWSYDPVIASTASIPTAGALQMVKVPVSSATTITNIILSIQTAGSGLTSGQCFAALYDASRNLLSITADQSTNWATADTFTMPLAAAQAVAAGDYYVGFWWRGTTGPSFARQSNAGAQINFGLSSAYRWSSSNTGLTTAAPNPANALVRQGIGYWAAVS